jgi:L-lactate dehydrogenase (cytochrome)
VPIILKGIQCWEDAVMAAEAGVQGIVLSNHGGRQLEFARSGIEVLVEVIEELKKRKLYPNPQFQVFLDGGVRRATDVLKAVALGATAGMCKQRILVEDISSDFIVGVGRPFLYAYSAYGQEGIDKALKILHVSIGW